MGLLSVYNNPTLDQDLCLQCDRPGGSDSAGPLKELPVGYREAFTGDEGRNAALASSAASACLAPLPVGPANGTEQEEEKKKWMSKFVSICRF